MIDSIKLTPLLESRKRLLPSLELNARERDGNGSSTNMLAQSRRFIGVAEYLVNGDTKSFRHELAASARCRLDLLKRFDEGEKISPSYASMTGGYKALLDALAAGDKVLSGLLASAIGGRAAIESKNDHPFDLALGYALKASVLESGDREACLAQLNEKIEATKSHDFKGYAIALSIVDGESSQDVNSAMEVVAEGHRRQSKGRGVFKGTEDEGLCVWGIGIANLLISRGSTVTLNDPILPRVLMLD